MNGIIKQNSLTGERVQFALDLSFGEAFIQVFNLRSMKDDNYYLIGILDDYK